MNLTVSSARSLILPILYLLPVFSSTSHGAAQLETGDRVRYDRHLDGTTAGGVFQFYHYDSGEYIRTFCTEIEQSLAEGSDYYVSLSPAINSSGKTISDYGKWSFVQYLNSNLPGQNDLTPNRSANSVQLGIWQDMGYVDTWGPICGSQSDWEQYRADRHGELPAQYLTGTDAHTPWQDAYQSDQAWSDGPGAAFVNIAQLWTSPDFTGGAQDTLVLVPGDPNVVPEPGMIAIWSLLGGFAFVAGKLRRRGT